VSGFTFQFLKLLVFLAMGFSSVGAGNVSFSTTSPRITSYEWQKDGRLKKVTRPNNTVREIKYDAAGRPDVIEEYGPGMKLIFVHKHGYYPSDEMQWRYELPSKRTSGNDPPAIGAMTYNADNQLATWNSQTVTHDADGNMTSGPSTLGSSLASYTYDARNRLTAALGTSYVYDADGQRVGMSQGGVITTFAVDVGSPLSKVLVRTKNGIPTRYVWGLGLLYEVNGSGATTTYHHDATGSTVALTNDTATVIERIGYTPWGQINHRINLSGTHHDTPFLFTGFFGNQSDGNGLLHMRNRYYHPGICRFLNADPAQEGMNWFAYGGGNPVGMVDPMGLGITSALNAVQTTLSFLGMTPVFGAVFDVVNAGISIGRGNYVDAGFNLASAIPGIGDFAAGAKLIGAGAAAYGGYRAYNAISHGVSAYRAPAAAAKTIAGGGDDAGRYLYHYTNPKSADNILAKGFDTRYTVDGSLYFTNKGNLSPIQAQIELALPANRQLPGSLLRIDAGALEKAGISPFIGPRRVQGNLPGLGSGGGTEFLFNQNIPSQFIQKVR
jgi:RHS repeat-associated protein